MFPYPNEQTEWPVIERKIFDAYTAAGRNLAQDFRPFRWWSRAAHSISVGMPAHEARTRALRELEAELHIDPMPVDGGLPVVGYPDESDTPVRRSWWNQHRDEVLKRYAEAKQPLPDGLDLDMFKWPARIAFSSARMPLAIAVARHLGELKAALARARVTGLEMPRMLVGPLHVQNRMWADATGYRRILGDSRFNLLRILKYDPARFYRILDRIVAARMQTTRQFLSVGGWDGYWNDHGVYPLNGVMWKYDPNNGGTGRPAGFGPRIDAWPDFDDLWRTMCREYLKRGLRIDVTFGDCQILTPDPEVEIALHRRCMMIAAEEGGAEVISTWQVTNEVPINRRGGDGPESIAQMGRVIASVKEILPNVLCDMGAFLSEEPERLYASITHGDVCAVHPPRSPFEMALKRSQGLVHWEGAYRSFPVPFDESEPGGPNIGPRDNVGDDSFDPINNPDELTSLYGGHGLTGQKSNFFDGASVRGLGEDDEAWGYDELPKMFEEHLPEDVATWPRESAGRGAIEYWTRDKRFATVMLKTWDPTPPHPIASWTMRSGDIRLTGTGQPPKMTGLLVGEFA